MPTPIEQPGLSELEEVLRRIGGTLNLDIAPENYPHVARKLYEGPGYDGGPLQGHDALNPEFWAAMDGWHDPELAMAQQLPEDLPPEEVQRMEAIRSKSLEGYTGTGWSPGERNALGRDPHPFELSPGDFARHQRQRDIYFLEQMLKRRKNDGQAYKPHAPGFEWSSSPGNSWDPTGLIPTRHGDWTGGVLARHPAAEQELTGEDWEKRADERHIRDALHWFNKSRDARFSVGGGPQQRQTLAELGGLGDRVNQNRTANYPQYGGYAGTAEAMGNPDYTFGWLSNNVFSPLEYAVNKTAMSDTANRDSGDLRKAGPLGYVAANVGDYFKNALMGDFHEHPLQSAATYTQAQKFNTHSPILPVDYEPDPYTRSELMQRVRGLTKQAENIDATDHYRARTGKPMSFVGQLGATIGSSLIDPTPILSARGGKGLAQRAAKIGGEVSEDLPTAVAASGLQIATPREPGHEVPPMHRWLNEGDRPDLPNETDEQFEARIKAQPWEQQKALQQLKQHLSNVPKVQTNLPASGTPSRSHFMNQR